MRRRWILVIAVALALAAGFAAGYVWRRTQHPTLEERAHDATEDLKSAVKKLTH